MFLLISEREERGNEKEKNIHRREKYPLFASHLCTDRESNLQPFSERDTNWATQQGQFVPFLKIAMGHILKDWTAITQKLQQISNSFH